MDPTDEIVKLKGELLRERALRAALMEIVPYAVVTATADYGLQVENSRAQQMLARMTASPSDSGSYQVLDEDGKPLPQEQWPIYRVISTGEPMYNRVVSVIDTNGKRLFQHVNVVPVFDDENRPFASLAVFLDNEVAEKYRLADILQSFQDCVISLDGTETIMYMNGHAEQLLKLSNDDVIGKKLQEVFPGVVQSEFMQRYLAAKESGATVRFDNWSEILGRWMRVSIHPFGDRTSITFNDDTDRKNLELQVHRNEQQLYTTLQSIGDAVIVTDKQGMLTLINPVAEQLTGWSSADAIGVHYHEVFNIISEATRLPALHPLDRVLREGVTVGLANHTLLVSKVGHEIPIDDSAAAIRNDCGDVIGAVLVFRDMTLRRQNEARTLQNQKMESVGKLAGGIAHDFNNLLTAIMGYTELAMDEVRDNAVVQKHLDRAMSAAERAGTLTARLLAFARQTTVSISHVNLNAVIADTIDMLRRLIGEHIELVTSLDPAVTMVLGDSTQLTQILVNLAINSRDAMPNGGTIFISTSVIERPMGAEDAPGDPNDRWVELVVHDTGPGLSSEAVEHLFEPFFTTKVVGEGTGLGLATSYGLIMQMGGQIRYENDEKPGATFRIQLPMAADNPSVAEASATKAPRPGSETILVVEDEPLVRDLAVRALRTRGYRVIDAANGKEAVERFLQHTGKISLVVTDMVMPEMGGRDLIAALLRIDPRLRILITTGYNADSDDSILEGIPTLLKPYLPSDLSDTIRTLLDTSTS